jgi:two-component system phosphate regulon response regulator OmpR
MTAATLAEPAKKAPPGGDASLLIVDDDPAIREELTSYLCMYGLRCTSVANGTEAERVLSEQEFNLVLLDLWLGNENGFDILSQLRKTSSIPCIMVTAQDEMTDKIVGLELGADDYLTKPVNMRELLARIRALMRRTKPHDPDDGSNGGHGDSVPLNGHRNGSGTETKWKFDPMRRFLSTPDGTPVSLTTAECDLLIELVSKEGLPQSRDKLCQRVFNRAWSPYDRSLDAIIVKLRRKLEPNPDHPLVIKTVRGRGYVFTGFPQ